MSIQLGWFITGFIVMLLMHSAYIQKEEEKDEVQFYWQMGLAFLLLLMSVLRIYQTW